MLTSIKLINSPIMLSLYKWNTGGINVRLILKIHHKRSYVITVTKRNSEKIVSFILKY